MAAITNAKNLRQYNSILSLIAEQMPAIASSSSFIKEVKYRV